jgi:hypothetical protein
MVTNTQNIPLSSASAILSDHKNLNKTGRKFRDRFYFVLILFLTSLPFLSAQDSLLVQHITIPDTTCSVNIAMQLIEQQTGLSFSYNTDIIDKKKIITLQGGKDELIHILDHTFGDPQLKFSIIGRHIVIYKAERTLSANPEKPKDSVYFFEIRGRVLDKTDRQPLPYSSIYLAKKAIGTVTNDNGEFLLKLPSKYLSDSLIVSCIGYKQIKAPVSSFLSEDKDFLLKPDVISIQEVIIRKISPVNLLQSATKAVSENYPHDPAILTSFYREMVKKGSRYMMVSEAILENYKSGYGRTAASDQVKILKGRKSQDPAQKDTVILKLKAGLNTMLLLDIVKNMPDFLTGENTQDYDYKMSDIVVDNGREQYAIEFYPKKGAGSNIFYEGRILLDVRNLAFTWIDFNVDPEKLEMATNNFIVKKPPYLKVKVLKADYKIGFRATGGKYYLHMIGCETEFRIRDRHQISGSVYHTGLEMAVTEIDTLNVSRFRARETARLNEFFTDQLGAYDESFWGEYNFISPEESLEEALVKLSRKNEDSEKIKDKN